MNLAASSSAALAAGTAQAAETKTAVLFAAPSVKDRYYRPFFAELLTFYAEFIERSAPGDHALVIADAATRKEVAKKVPAAHVIEAAIDDIWMRDPSPVWTPNGLVRFRYHPRHLGARQASKIQDQTIGFLTERGIAVQSIDLNVDGGNVVQNFRDRAVVSSRVLKDYPKLSEEACRAAFQKALGVKALAVIPEEGDLLGHADGMVKWLSPDVLAVNPYAEADYAAEIKTELTTSLPGVKLVTMPWAPSEKEWRGFADATGIYVNGMTTPNAIYVPTYGKPQDEEALAIHRQHADRPIIPISMGGVALMGGSVRCLSWQIWGAAVGDLI